MEQMKRSRDNSTDEDDDNNKRRRASVTTDQCVTSLEDLSNELIYEIFEFLYLHHASQAFYDLNERFQNLFTHSNLPMKINISSISKPNFHRYLTDIVVPQTDRIQSLRLSSPFADEMFLFSLPTMEDFVRLETLVINDIEAAYIEAVLNQLLTLPVLSSLTITSDDYMTNRDGMYQKIFHLPALKYCQMSIETKRMARSLPFATNKFSPIEQLIIKNEVSLDQFDSLLSYVPQLRRLSLGHFNGARKYRICPSSISSNYLTAVSLKPHSVSFNDFQSLATDFFRQVQILRITVYPMQYFISDLEYMNADRWERLLSTHMPNLRIFDFYDQSKSWYGNPNRQTYEIAVSKFNSLFWMQHQWFFELQYHKKRYYENATFYSANPYRRKKFILFIEPANGSLQTNVDSVRHVCIHNTNTMNQFLGRFTNASELTLSEKFDVPRDSLVIHLNRIIPVRQLTKLSLQCHRLPFERVIELLHFAPHVHTLELNSILLFRTSFVSMQQNTLFQLVSNTNTVTNLIIDKEITLEKIQLLVGLFPRLKYLTINLYKEDLESIARFLLSKTNDNTRHLSVLCISKQLRELVSNLRLLIESEKLLSDYTLKTINRKLYLWW